MSPGWSIIAKYLMPSPALLRNADAPASQGSWLPGRLHSRLLQSLRSARTRPHLEGNSLPRRTPALLRFEKMRVGPDGAMHTGPGPAGRPPPVRGGTDMSIELSRPES